MSASNTIWRTRPSLLEQISLEADIEVLRRRAIGTHGRELADLAAQHCHNYLWRGRTLEEAFATALNRAEERSRSVEHGTGAER